MSIETRCHGCGKMLRVADEHAGKRARCPECGFVYTVAAASTPASQQERPLAGPGQSLHTAAGPLSSPPTPTQVPSPQPTTHQPSAKSVGDPWYMKTPEGQIYGPVERRQLDIWVGEGRVTEDCYLRQGEYGSWQRAAAVYPVLASAQAQPAAARPTAMVGGGAYRGFAPAGAGHYPSYSSHQRPHRGAVILVLALLSWPFGCMLLSIIAWVMAAEDIGQMRRGTMDPSGMGITQAGMVIAIVNVALNVLAIAGICLLSLVAN